jgi:hypothetical protein
MNRRKILLTVWILALVPIYITLLASISRSQFFADDFLWGSRFQNSPGSLFNGSAYAGRLLGNNLYWFFMGLAVGHGSAVPYLMTNLSLILASYVLVYHSFKRHRPALVVSFTFLSISASLFESVLWSANISHCLGFFFVAATACCLTRLKDKNSRRQTLFFLPLISVIASLAILSNQIFIGPAFLFFLWALIEVFKITRYSMTHSFTALFSFLWLLLICAFSVKSSNQFWASFGARDLYGLSFHAIRPNIDWYWNLLVANNSVQKTLLITAVLSWITLIVIRLSRRDQFIQIFAGPILGLSVLIPVLAQANQRSSTYLLLPLAATPLIYIHEKSETKFDPKFFVNLIQYVLVISAVLLIFLSGRDVRSYFSENSRGQSLQNISQQVDELDESSLCFVLDSEVELQRFAAETQAGAAFQEPFGFLIAVQISEDIAECDKSQMIVQVHRDSDDIWIVKTN